MYIFIINLLNVISSSNWYGFSSMHTTGYDWAEKIKYLVSTSYPDKQKIILVMANLNPPIIASLYKTFPTQEARRIARKLEINYTPKHGSCLDIAET